jgi:hypothetical protein
MPTPQRITYVLDDLFTPETREMSDGVLGYLLEALTAIDVLYLTAHPETPAIYDSGVVYQEEPPGAEDWANIPMILKLGWGDCEELACWRAAELQVRANVRARASFTKQTQSDGTMLYHITVLLPDGRVEDPSRQLGMR